MRKHKKWLTLLGKFQNIPLLERDINIIKRFLKRGKNILIMIKKENAELNPEFTPEEKLKALWKTFPNETKTGKIIGVIVPDINEIKIMRET